MSDVDTYKQIFQYLLEQSKGEASFEDLGAATAQAIVGISAGARFDPATGDDTVSALRAVNLEVRTDVVRLETELAHLKVRRERDARKSLELYDKKKQAEDKAARGDVIILAARDSMRTSIDGMCLAMYLLVENEFSAFIQGDGNACHGCTAMPNMDQLEDESGDFMVTNPFGPSGEGSSYSPAYFHTKEHKDGCTVVLAVNKLHAGICNMRKVL